MKVVALAGGVGGAKLANGLAQILEPDDLTIIVNTGDDFIYSGLYICPDLDTVTYTLAGINDPINGWGLRNESWNVLNTLELLGHPIWFKLGDRDLAMHIERTRLLQSGISLTEVVHSLSRKLGVRPLILPMADSQVQTMIDTYEFGLLTFQEYFVKHRFQPTVKSIEFVGIKDTLIPDPVHKALESTDLVIFCPSNPFVSIQPILTVPGIRDLVSQKPVIAVSPLIRGKTLKDTCISRSRGNFWKAVGNEGGNYTSSTHLPKNSPYRWTSLSTASCSSSLSSLNGFRSISIESFFTLFFQVPATFP